MINKQKKLIRELSAAYGAPTLQPYNNIKVLTSGNGATLLQDDLGTTYYLIKESEAAYLVKLTEKPAA
jgi:hypothetical protein